MSVPGSRRSGLRSLAFLIGAVATATFLVVAGIAATTPIPPPPDTTLRIEGVIASPNPPSPGAVITVRATVRGFGAGSASMFLQWASDFGVAQASGGSMVPTSTPNEYEASFGPFPDGTEVWFVVGASSFAQDPVVSIPRILRVGVVPRGGSSGLGIASVVRSPENPSPFQTAPITISANVGSNATISAATLSYAYFARFGIDALNTAMVNLNGSVFHGSIDPGRLSSGVFDRGAILFYRIAAQDATNNTAASEIFSYRFPNPQPVP